MSEVSLYLREIPLLFFVTWSPPLVTHSGMSLQARFGVDNVPQHNKRECSRQGPTCQLHKHQKKH